MFKVSKTKLTVRKQTNNGRFNNKSIALHKKSGSSDVSGEIVRMYLFTRLLRDMSIYQITMLYVNPYAFKTFSVWLYNIFLQNGLEIFGYSHEWS